LGIDGIDREIRTMGSGDGKLITAFILGIARMSLNPTKINLMLRRNLQQTLP
jgi:Flp pilus assembly protein protease CpaA